MPIITYLFFRKKSVWKESEPLNTVVSTQQPLSLSSQKSLSGEDNGESLVSR